MRSFIFKAIPAGIATSAAYVAYDIQSKIRSDSHTQSSACYQYLLHIAMSSLGKYARKKFDQDSTDFRKAQEETLLSLIDKHKDTALGIDFDFKNINSSEMFRETLPLTNYNFYKSKYITRILSGEENIMTQEKVDLLGATSGTSGHKSLIPHTAQISKVFFLQGITVVFDGLFSKAFAHANQLQKTCKLTFQPRWQYIENEGPDGKTKKMKVGPASSSPDDKGFDRLLPLYTSPKEAFQIKNEKAAFYCHIYFAMKDKNLGIIESNFSPIVLTFFSMMEEHHTALIDDIRNGTLKGAEAFGIDPAEVAALKKYLKPDEKRALELEKAFARHLGDVGNSDLGYVDSATGAASASSLARSIWPNLNLILTVTTGSFQPYAERLNTMYIKGCVPFFSPLYAATEGLIGVNVTPSEDKMFATYALLPRALFYEFIPVSNTESTKSKSTRTLLSHQLEIGQEYELVITNQAGLVRYRIGDVVKLERFENTTPVVSFQYRLGQLLNVRGEKMTENVLTKAVKEASNKIGISATDFCAAEDVIVVDEHNSSRPRYHIFIEPRRGQQEANTLSKTYDEYLQKYSEVYKSYRVKGAIEAPVVHILGKGSFDEFRGYMLRENTNGTITQFKVPRVIKLKKAVEFLLSKEV